MISLSSEMTVIRHEMLKTKGSTDKFTEDEINAIWAKEFIYNFAVIMIEIMHGDRDFSMNIKKVYEEGDNDDGVRFTAMVAESAGLDPVITAIINDCLKPLSDRPDFPIIVNRLREWGAMECYGMQ